jgi:Asp-tRNA(Asn)/Glu-tRNA(Gln) amidotransferase A subunit family amidase
MFLGFQGAKESKGMPVAVQIVGLPFHEEVVLRGMREIESLRIARA